jgi:signal transduction histidine kinase
MSATAGPQPLPWPQPLWAWFRAIPSLWKDAALGVVVFVASVVEIAVSWDFTSPVATFGALLVISTAIALRRVHPAIAPVAAGAALFVQELFHGHVSDGGDAAFVGFLFLLYGLGAYTEFRTAVIAGVLSWAFFVADALADRFAGSVSDFAFITMFVGASITIGRAIRNRRLLNRALRERAARLEAERADRAAAAVAAERRRIASELHDVVTHAVSSMVVQAGAVRHVVKRDPAAARSTLGDIELTGRDALAEMRRLLGVLRRDEDREALSPQPGVARVGELVAAARERGLAAGLEVAGDPVVLSPGLDLVAFRVVEEALEAATHGAGATRAMVRVRYGEATLDLEVSDDGGRRRLAGLDSDPQLVSIRERVSLFGGEFSAGVEGSGFVVRARLPVERPVAA